MSCNLALKYFKNVISQKKNVRLFGLKKCFLAVIFVVFAFSAKAQFTYVGSGLTYELTAYRLNFEGLTVHHNLKWNIGAMWRPIRKLGIGASIGIPVLQGTHFSFKGSPTTNGNKYYDFDPTFIFGSDERYKPDFYEYDFNYSASYTLSVRQFFSGENTWYADLRLTFLNIQETFQVDRPYKPTTYYSSGNLQYPAVEKLDIDYSQEHTVFIPGTVLGFNRVTSKHLRFGMYFGLDFLFFNSDPFEYDFSFEWDSSLETNNLVTVTSQTEKLNTILSVNFSLNYSF